MSGPTLALKQLRGALGVMHLRWRAARWPSAPIKRDGVTTAPPRLLILPSDPWTLTGARGDEAMMTAVLAPLRARHPNLIAGVVTATPKAAQAARELGLQPVLAWSARFDDDHAAMRRFAPDRVVILGADVMDGYYGVTTSARLLLLADALARSGVPVVVLGFSFNADPHPALAALFDRLDERVALAVRDPISLARLRAFTRRKVDAVADAAFLLEPAATTPDTAPIAQWAAARRAQGESVLGFNLHPMLVRPPDAARVDALVRDAACALRTVARQRRVALLLISHDQRDAQGDDVCLAPIHAALRDELGARVLYPTAPLGAAELKAVAGMTDAVVTGRMHLAIAALGMGRPVAGLTYQDKFHGLFAHFGIPERYLLAPEALDKPRLTAMTLALLDELPARREEIARALPAVLDAARRNLALLSW